MLYTLFSIFSATVDRNLIEMCAFSGIFSFINVHMSLCRFWHPSVYICRFQWEVCVCHWGTCLHSFQRIIHFLLKWGSSPSEEGLKGGWEQAFILLQQQLVIWGVYAPVGRREMGRKERRVLEEWRKGKKEKGVVSAEDMMKKRELVFWAEWAGGSNVEETKKEEDLDWAKDGKEGRLQNLQRRKRMVSEKWQWARKKITQTVDDTKVDQMRYREVEAQ